MLKFVLLDNEQEAVYFTHYPDEFIFGRHYFCAMVLDKQLGSI